MLVGIRGELPRPNWRLATSANLASSLGRDEGRWLLADATIARNWVRTHHGFSLTANGFGLRYDQPFEYNAYALELQPALALRFNSLQLAAMPRATAGTWSSDSLNGGIRVVGGSAQIANTFRALTVAVTGEAHDAENGALDGTYHGVGLEANLGVGFLALGGSLKRWRNPLEDEWGYSAFATMHVSSGIYIDARLARSVTDPVLASPGSFGASIGVSWRLLSSAKRQPPPVARVVRERSPTRVVVFTVEVDADSVALSGSFSEWKPIPMLKKGGHFTLEVDVPPGMHHYGFLLNGREWYVPKNALGIVDDDFGRKNATLVIERP